MKNFKFYLLFVFFISTFIFVCLMGCTNSEVITTNTTYTVSYLSDGNGTIEGKTVQEIQSNGLGEEVRAIPYDGYKFVQWSDGITTATRTETNVNSNITVTAIFEKADNTVIAFTVTYKTEGYGTVKGKASQSVAFGESSDYVTAVPDEGYKFVKWSDGSTSATRQEKNVNADITVTAIFEKSSYTVKYVGNNGTIEGKAEQTVLYDEDGEVVTAIPNEGYVFVEWSDGIKTASRKEKNVKRNFVIGAVFERLSYTVGYGTDGNGTINGNNRQTVFYGENTENVIAIPNEGCKFVEWSDGQTNANRIDVAIKENFYVYAKFIKQSFSIKYNTDGNGTINGKNEQILQYGDDSEAVTAIPNEGYRFVKWSDGVTTATRQETNVKTDVTITAVFERRRYTIMYNTTSVFGKIEGKIYQTVAYGEDSTAVTAVPNTGYKFVQWSDGNTNPTRQETNVKENISLTPTFEKLTFTITYTTDGNGTIEGAETQTVEYGKPFSSVTAVPNTGYRFVQWSDGNTFPRRQDLAYEDKSVTAVFEELTLEVTYYVNGGYFMVDGEKVHQTYKQNVKYGGDTDKKLKPILYNSDEDFTFKYVFIKWSDGVETEERQDFNVTDDIFVTAIFGIRLTYSVDGNKGGKLTGNCTQILEEGGDAEKITAVPDDGYVFDGWSDWSEQMMNPERQDINVVKSTNYVAYFSPIEKTFKYDYGEVFGAPLQDKVVINRYKLNEVKFVLPEMQGYTFCGWYADKDYKMMLANENGKLMLGYYTFNLDTDTIYARWKIDAADGILTYKILTLCVEELHVPDLKMYVDDDLRVDVHYTTSTVLRKLFAMYSVKVAQYLNEWFEGKINFEVDTYYTTEIVNEGNFYVFQANSTSNRYAYELTHTSLSEISDLLEDEHNYRNVMAIYDFGPKYSVKLRGGAIAGYGHKKYGVMYIDCNFSFHKDEVNIYVQRLEREFHKESESFLKDRFEGLPNLWDHELALYLHEFCHTIQFKCDDKIVGDFHEVEYGHGIMDAKNYLLGKAVVDGKIQAIPSSYWTEGGKNMF